MLGFIYYCYILINYCVNKKETLNTKKKANNIIVTIIIFQTGTIGTPDGDIYIRPVAAKESQISSPHLVWKIRGRDSSNLGNDESSSGKSGWCRRCHYFEEARTISDTS